jgi:hypothetical protein
VKGFASLLTSRKGERYDVLREREAVLCTTMGPNGCKGFIDKVMKFTVATK